MLLHEDVERLSVLVDGAPEPVPLATHAHRHLIEMPCAPAACLPPAQLVGVLGAEVGDPATHRLVAHLNAALHEELFHVAVAERETKVEADGVGDHRAREAVPVVRVRGLSHRRGGSWRKAPKLRPPRRQCDKAPDTDGKLAGPLGGEPGEAGGAGLGVGPVCEPRATLA